jgi:hypothetical protein
VSFVAATFLSDFVLPLVRGGQLHVGRPLDEEDIDLLQAEVLSGTEEGLAIEQARQDRAADLWLYPVDTPLDEVCIGLSAGLHNLLFMSHPDARSWRVKTSSRQRLERFTSRWLDQPAPTSDHELVARHTLTANLFLLSRLDVHLSYWAGRRRYLGCQPPTRMLRWGRLRRVHQKTERVDWLESGLSSVQQELFRQLLAQTPLTDLLNPLRDYPPFDWLSVTCYLQRPSICRVVCHRYLELGLERVGPVLARSFWKLVDGSPSAAGRRQAVGLAAGLVTYLYASSAMHGELPDSLAIDLQDPTSHLSSVLMAAARCGLLPTQHQLGDARVKKKLEHWVEGAVQQLAGRSGELVTRLQRSLAA